LLLLCTLKTAFPGQKAVSNERELVERVILQYNNTVIVQYSTSKGNEEGFKVLK